MVHRLARFEAFDSVIPDVGEVTLAEVNGKLVVGDENALMTRTPELERTIGPRYPSIAVSYACQPDMVSKPSARTIVLEQLSSEPALHEFTPDALWKWIDEKQEQILVELKRYPQVQQLLNFQHIIWTVFLDLVKTKLSPALNFTIGNDYYKELSLLHQRAPVKIIEWHRYRSSFSIVQRQDVILCHDVFLGDAEVRQPLALVHELQKGVTAVEWKPNSGSVLAVATVSGVCLWRIKYPSLAQVAQFKPSPFASTSSPTSAVPLFEANLPTEMEFLSYSSFTNLISLSWSPDGQLLVAASATTSMMVVWDYMNIGTPLRTPGFLAGGTKKVIFSPCGGYLLQICVVSKMVIWETGTWSYTEVFVRSPCQSAVWTPDGSRIIFALEGEAALYAVSVEKGPLATRVIVPERPENIRLNKHVRITGTGQEVIVGGSIKSIALDSITGSRLAISFVESDFVLLCRLELSPTPEYHPIGFIRGRYWNKAITDIPSSPYQPHVRVDDVNKEEVPGPHCIYMTFSRVSPNGDKKGVVLSLVWEDGTVQNFPINWTGLRLEGT